MQLRKPNPLRAFLGALAVLLVVSATAQTRTQTGAEVLTLPAAPGPSNTLEAYPDLKALLMPTRNMRDRQMSAYYAVCAAVEFYLNAARLHKLNLSPDYLYLRLLRNDVPTETILDLFQTEGTISAGLVPYGADRLPPQHVATEHYRIRGYVALFPDTAAPLYRAERVREALARGHPVVVTCRIRQNFLELPERAVHYHPDAGNTQLAGTHTLLATRFYPEERTVELMNSWGTGWGERGCLRVDYADFAEMVAGAWVVTF